MIELKYEINDTFRKKFNLPLMFHGKSVAEPQSHGIVAPPVIGSSEFEEGLNDMLTMVNAARQLSPITKELGKVLDKYNPFEVPKIGYEGVLRAMGFHSWNALVKFIEKDKCLELYVRMEHYLDDNNIPYNQDRDFIGNEVGQYKRLASCSEPTALKAGNVKYFYKHLRPLEYLTAKYGRDVRHMVNGVHPPHYEYIPWHAAKFGECLDVSRRQFNFTDYRQIGLVNANAYYLGAQARGGLGVHYAESNAIGMKIAGIPELKDFYNE